MIGLIFGPPGSGKGKNMRKNLPVFPHRRAGFAGAPALFPAVWIIEKLRLATFGSVLSELSRGRDEPGRPGHVGMVE
jgi:hypothetical protein